MGRLRYRLWLLTRELFRAIPKIPRFIKYTILLIILAASADVGRYAFYPDVAALATARPGRTAFMEHTEERWERDGRRKKITQKWVPLSMVSRYAIAAVVISEDDKFWEHEGFDLEAMRKALGHDIIEGRIKFGGSTISQQLAKNLYLSPSKNPLRKLKEAVLAYRIERNLSKRRILEIYLNVVEWGDGVYGIEAASRKYFAKRASSITPYEGGLLAAALPAPRRYNPGKPGRYLRNRSAELVAIMRKRGIVEGASD